jgi:Na+-driven multidrug efflux pump
MDIRVAPSPPAVTRMSLRQHIRRTMALAVPVMLARAGLIIMMTVGTVMVGQAGPHELAWFAISLAPQNMMLVIGIGLLIGGAVLTEKVFSINGLGMYAVTAISDQDMPKVMGVVLVATIFIVFANLLVDLMYAVIDPRVRTK